MRQHPDLRARRGGALSAQPREFDLARKEPPAEVTRNRLVEGFLQAMADPGDDYAVARQYLTAGAAGVVASDHSPGRPDDMTTDLDGTARLDGELLGELDATGRLTSTYVPFTYDFGLIREQGEWRIGTPPEGLLLSRFIFERYYSRVPLYFMSRAGAASCRTSPTSPRRCSFPPGW